MPQYLISFDIKNGSPEDYDDIHSSIQKFFSNNCRILTTTYLVKVDNNLDLDKTKENIKESIDNSIHIIVAKLDSWSGSYPSDALDCVKNNIRN